MRQIERAPIGFLLSRTRLRLWLLLFGLPFFRVLKLAFDFPVGIFFDIIRVDLIFWNWGRCYATR